MKPITSIIALLNIKVFYILILLGDSVTCWGQNKSLIEQQNLVRDIFERYRAQVEGNAREAYVCRQVVSFWFQKGMSVYDDGIHINSTDISSPEAQALLHSFNRYVGETTVNYRNTGEANQPSVLAGDYWPLIKASIPAIIEANTTHEVDPVTAKNLQDAAANRLREIYAKTNDCPNTFANGWLIKITANCANAAMGYLPEEKQNIQSVRGKNMMVLLNAFYTQVQDLQQIGAGQNLMGLPPEWLAAYITIFDATSAALQKL